MARETLNSDVHMCRTRISWSAILVGALIIIGLSFLLNLFGVAIGLSAFATDTLKGTASLALGGFIGVVIGIVVATLVAGYTAGYLGRLYSPRRNLGIVYGFTTWSLALLLTVFFAAPIAKYVADYTTIVTHSAASSLDSPTATNKAAKVAAEKPLELKGSFLSKGIAWSAGTVFVLFFIGAISCCLGACWGMNNKHDD